MLPLIISILSLVVLIRCQEENCDAACQAAFDKAYAEESSLWVSKDIEAEPFYQTPANFSGAKTGDLLSWEDITAADIRDNWQIPDGLKLSRFIFVSEDYNGSPLPASAFALLPAENSSKPLNPVVWTHGTSGRVQACAPSNHKQLYYGDTVFNLTKAGYAVIAPDYTGQGTKIPQGFMYESGFLHAADVAYSLIAARSSPIGSRLSDSWLVAGHSEGGMTAWRTNERLGRPDQCRLLRAGTFLGAVAIAPALRPIDLIPESFRRAGPDGAVGDVVSAYLLKSFSRLFPTDIREEDYFTDLARDRMVLADRACLQTGEALFQNLTVEQYYKNTSWVSSTTFQVWQESYNGAGPHRLAAPLLVTQGAADILVYPEFVEKDFNSTCAAFSESSAQFNSYAGDDHEAILTSAEPDYLSWIADRFNGVAITPGCSIHRKSG